MFIRYFRFMFAAAVFWLSAGFIVPAQAVLKVDITRGHIAPLPIAITDFSSAGTAESALAEDIVQVLTADLKRSGLFKPSDPKAFIQKLKGVDTFPRFADWRAIDAQALVVGHVEGKGNTITVQFRLWDTLSERQFAGKSFTADKSHWRRMAHLVADEIYHRLTGETGYFDSRIVYIAESGDRRRKVKKLAMMDQDGANVEILTSGKELTLTPRFDPASQRIVYMAYYNKKPRVYLYDIRTRKETLLGQFPGMSFAPRFSPDGKKVVMSVAMDGNSEIFVMDLGNKSTRRLTYNSAIDTSPSFSPDGRQVVFNSDRGGTQQLYVMDSNGENVKRISFGSGTYGDPVWSPRGDLVAFTRMQKGVFHIGVMRPDGSGERLLTSSYLDESPTWAPNGRVIMFARQVKDASGKPSAMRLFSIDLTGYNEREIKTPSGASDPAWSPLLSQ